MKISTSVVFLFFNSIATLSQPYDLLNLLENKPKTNETIIWLCDTATSIQEAYPSDSERIAKIAIDKAHEWNLEAYALILANECLGNSLFLQEKYDASIDSYNEALLLFDQIEEIERRHFQTMLSIQVNIARVNISMNLFEKANSQLDSILIKVRNKELKAIELLVYNAYAEMYAKTGNYQRALQSYATMTALDKNLKERKVRQKIDELNLQYETEKKVIEVAKLERENAKEQSVKIVLTIIVTSIIIAFILILIFSIHKRKKERLIAQLELQQLSQKIITKTNAITTYTLNFLQKNQLMEDLKQQINDLKNSSAIEKNKGFSRINRIMDSTFRSDEEWKIFQITFDQMHDGFFKDLKQKFPNVSNAEMKLCALLRLNMNLKESSKILGIAPDSVKTARYRLRKKLGLKTEDNLVDFLLQFEKSDNSDS